MDSLIKWAWRFAGVVLAGVAALILLLAAMSVYSLLDPTVGPAEVLYFLAVVLLGISAVLELRRR